MATNRFAATETIEPLVVRALTSWGIPERHIGAEFGVSGSCIGNIRRGANHKTVRPDLPRWRSCEDCRHWSAGYIRCTLDFPEPEELGLVVAATECAVFVRR